MINYFLNCFQSTLKEKQIPSLDGLRAVSVFFVVFGHVVLLMNPFENYRFFIYQDLGVSLFFVISGFLITLILKDEMRKNGQVSLWNFFVKRVFRIFPAYYLFLFITYFTSSFFDINFTGNDLFSAFLYLGFYFPQNLNAVWAHSWSLAIEEQFYLIWPFVITSLKKQKTLLIFCLVAILVSPAIRVMTYYFSDLYKHKYHFLLHARFDTLMFGCALALGQELLPFQKVIRLFKSKPFFIFSLLYLLLIYPLLNYYFGGKFRATIGYSIEGVLLSGVIIHVINAKETFYFKILNSRPVIHIGSISYGIYLWQQPFTYIKEISILPYNILGIYLAALISYALIEYPLLKLRGKFLR